jgi:hypothetical protein
MQDLQSSRFTNFLAPDYPFLFVILYTEIKWKLVLINSHGWSWMCNCHTPSKDFFLNCDCSGTSWYLMVCILGLVSTTSSLIPDAANMYSTWVLIRILRH